MPCRFRLSFVNCYSAAPHGTLLILRGGRLESDALQTKADDGTPYPNTSSSSCSCPKAYFVTPRKCLMLSCSLHAALAHHPDPCGQLGRRVDVAARAEGLHRVHQRAPVGAASAKELASALEPVRVLQPRQRQVSFSSAIYVAILLLFYASAMFCCRCRLLKPWWGFRPLKASGEQCVLCEA